MKRKYANKKKKSFFLKKGTLKMKRKMKEKKMKEREI